MRVGSRLKSHLRRDSSTHDGDCQPKNKVLCSTCVRGPPLAGDLGTKSHGLQQLLCAEGTVKPTSDALSEPSARMERACICSSLALVKDSRFWSPKRTTEPKSASVFNSRHPAVYCLSSVGWTPYEGSHSHFSPGCHHSSWP